MKKIIYLITFILLSIFVSAQTLDYPYFMGVNETETITISGTDDVNLTNESYYLAFEGTLNSMAEDSAESFYSISITSNEEEDIPFTVIGLVNGSFTRHNNSDASSETTYSVLNNFKHVFTISEEENKTVITPGTHEVCINIAAKLGIQYRFVSGLQVNDSNNITWSYSGIKTSDNTDYGYKCDIISYNYPVGIYNVTEYLGFECLNCGLPNKLFIRLDTTNITNKSKTLSTDFYNSSVNISTGNFDMFASDFHNDIFYQESAVMLWRIPFYLTINLLKQQTNNDSELMWTNTETEAYCNEFQYIYLQNANTIYDGTFKDMSYLDDWFGWMPYYKPTFSDVQDTEVSYWDKYENCEASIKLYEAGNYTVTLLSTDVSGLAWNEEFIYPQFGSKLSKSEIVSDSDSMIIVEETNTTVSIYASMYEVNKFNFLANLGYNMLIIFGAIGILVLASMSSDLKLAVILIPIWITFMKLMGLVIF